MPTSGFAVIDKSGAYVTLMVFTLGLLSFITLEVLSELGIVLSDDPK